MSCGTAAVDWRHGVKSWPDIGARRLDDEPTSLGRLCARLLAFTVQPRGLSPHLPRARVVEHERPLATKTQLPIGRVFTNRYATRLARSSLPLDSWAARTRLRVLHTHTQLFAISRDGTIFLNTHVTSQNDPARTPQSACAPRQSVSQFKRGHSHACAS